MPRKKVNADTDVIDGIAEIDDGEQLVEETTRKVRRERVTKPKPEPAAEIIDLDEDDEPDEQPPAFSETSIAAKLFSDDGGQPFENRFCTINVRRTPDSMNDRFANPNSAMLNLAPIRNVDIATDQSDIEDLVRREYGGGHYFFQIHFDGQLRTSWRSTLADLPAHARNQTPEPQPPTAAAAPPTPAKDPLDSMLDNLAKMKALRDALFGDERDRLERQIEELKREIDNRPEPRDVTPLPENLQILEKALATNNPTLQEKLLDYAFPQDTGGHWIPDTLKVIFDHKDEIGGILSGLLGVRPQPQPPNIEAILRGTPPAALPTPAVTASHFQRKPTAGSGDGETAATETQEPTDEHTAD